MSHQSAILALAFQWIHILFRMWKHHTPNNDAHDIQALAKSHIPLANRSSISPESSKNVT